MSNTPTQSKGISFEELQKEWKKQEEWDAAHPIRAFVYGIPDFFIYVIPRKLGDWQRDVKWGFQRMFRGYDDPYVWNFHYCHAELNLKALKKLREIKHGSPYVHDPDGVLKTKSKKNVVDDKIHERWEECLNLIIRGFEAMIEIDDVHILDKDGTYDPKATKKQRDKLMLEWEKGMKLFVANYRGIWD